MKQKGFSLIELLFACALISILLLMSTSVSDVFHKKNVQGHAIVLFQALQFARLEAIKRHQTVWICGTQDFVQCHSQQNKGYIIYTNPPNQLDNKIVLRSESLAQDVSLTFPKQLFIHFSPFGQSATPGVIAIDSNGFLQKIVISTSGRVRIIPAIVSMS